MIEIRPYRPGDEKGIEPVEETLREHELYERMWAEVVDPERTWTLSCDGRVGMVGGWIPQDQAALVWMIMDVHVKARTASRMARLGLAEVLRTRRAIETVVSEHFTPGQRLARHLGFIPTDETLLDGTVRRYGCSNLAID